MKTNIKPTSNLAECGNKSKPLLCEVVLAKKFNSAYVADSYTKQNENYQKIADDFALEFSKYVLSQIYNMTHGDKSGISIENLLVIFKRDVFHNLT